MKLKRKLAGLLVALMVLTMGNVMAFAEEYNSPQVPEISKPTEPEWVDPTEKIEEGIILRASDTDMAPALKINGLVVKDVNAAIKKGYEYKSTKYKLPIFGVELNYVDTVKTPITKVSLEKMATNKNVLRVKTIVADAKEFNTRYFTVYQVVNATKDVSFDISTEENAAVTAALKEAGYTGFSRQITLVGTGKLPGKTEIEMYSNGIEKGKHEGHAYYYNAATKKFEYLGEAGTTEENPSFWMDGAIDQYGTIVYVDTKLKDAQKVTSVDVSSFTTKEELAEEVKEAVDNAEKGEIVVFTPAKGVPVTKDVFQEAKDKGVVLEIGSLDGTFSIRFKDLTTLPENFDMSATTTVTPEKVEKALAENFKDKAYVSYTFGPYEGSLGGKQEIPVDVSGKFADGKTVFLYYVNEKTGKYELASKAEVVNGMATLEIEHFSTYVIVDEKLPTALTGVTDTGDATPIALFVLVLIAGMSALGIAVLKRKSF